MLRLYVIAFIRFIPQKNVDIQEKIFEEISQLETLDQELPAKQVYLNAVISETLRITPPVNRFDREAAKDYRLGNMGIIIPKGALVTFIP
jgi:cytochrome P450